MRPHRQNLQAAIWLIGIGFLLLTHHWWPGILILVGISMVAGALTRGTDEPERPWSRPSYPQQPQQPPAPMPPVQPPPVYTSFVTPPPKPVYDLNWVPNHCASCGGPLNVSGMKVLDSQTVVCPFCGSKISKAN